MPIIDVDIEQAGYQNVTDVIREISFSVEKGEIVGLIGPNGAGKSTTIKAILSLVKEMKGKIHFKDSNQLYAYVPEHPVFYDQLTLWEHLEMIKAVYELDDKYFIEKSGNLLKDFDMEQVKHDYPKSFSKGMQQKMLLIIAFLIDPPLYIVDEPFIGLDPIATRKFLDILIEEKNKGKSILMSTHVLDTAEKICDQFVLIEKGSVLMKGTLAEIRGAVGDRHASLLDSFYHLVGRGL